MILDASRGIKGKVVDLDTGKVVPKVKSLNTDTGLLVAYRTDAHGNALSDGNGNWLTYTAVGRFRFTPSDGSQVPAKKIVMGAPSCTKCLNRMTLPGDDLCVRCRATDRNQRHRMTVEAVIDPFDDHKCEDCTEKAAWCVSDEVETTPQAGMSPSGKVLFERAATVGRRWYCSRHFKPPRLLDARGEEIKELDNEKVRPQW